MAEWLKAPVLKTGDGLPRSRVRISIPPPNSDKKARSDAGFFAFRLWLKNHSNIKANINSSKLAVLITPTASHSNRYTQVGQRVVSIISLGVGCPGKDCFLNITHLLLADHQHGSG